MRAYVTLMLGIGVLFLIGMFIDRRYPLKEPVPCKCKTSEQIINLHEKRSMWVDKLEYPTKVLTKKEKENIIDSITKYTNLLK